MERKLGKKTLGVVDMLGASLGVLVLTSSAFASSIDTSTTSVSGNIQMTQDRPAGEGQMGGMETGDLLEKIEAELEENGTELPDGWDDMTNDEKMAYLQENDLMPEMGELGEMNGETFQHRAEGAIHGERYQKFEGELEDEVDFSDSDSDAVTYLQRRGVIDGYSDGTFRPNNSINRAESLKIILTALGIDCSEASENSFSDVDADAWYADYVDEAADLGIVNGYEDGTFHPEETVNQAELLKLAFASFGIDLSDYTVTDESLDASQWYAVYFQYALDTGLLTSDEINPGKGMTRAAFSELVYNLILQQEALNE